jgi:hypothetical protein
MNFAAGGDNANVRCSRCGLQVSPHQRTGMTGGIADDGSNRRQGVVQKLDCFD